MKRLVCVGMMVVGVLGVSALMNRPEAQGADPEPASIKAIMQGLSGKSKSAAIPSAKKALSATPTDWAGAKAATATIANLTKSLPKFEAPEGDNADFVKQAEAYHAAAKSLADAAKSENLDAAKGALGKLGMSCMACHKAHRPK